MKKVEIYSSSVSKFLNSQRRAYHYNVSGVLDSFLVYPEERVEPALTYIETGSDIVQGQYKWSANCSHLLFDVLSDYFIGSSLFNKKKIITKTTFLSNQILTSLGSNVVEGVNFPDGINPNRIHQYDYLENTWRFSGMKHKYISKIIRETFSQYCAEDKTSPKNIIINRRPKSSSYGFTYSRNINNIDQFVRSASESGYDFKVIDLEDFSFHDQIKLFYNAEKIISAHGSGLVWLNFCKEGTKVVEIITPYFYNDGNLKPDFWYISQNNGLNHKTVYIKDAGIIGDGMHPYDHDVLLEWPLFDAILSEDE